MGRTNSIIGLLRVHFKPFLDSSLSVEPMREVFGRRSHCTSSRANYDRQQKTKANAQTRQQKLYLFAFPIARKMPHQAHAAEKCERCKEGRKPEQADAEGKSAKRGRECQ